MQLEPLLHNHLNLLVTCRCVRVSVFDQTPLAQMVTSQVFTGTLYLSFLSGLSGWFFIFFCFFDHSGLQLKILAWSSLSHLDLKEAVH